MEISRNCLDLITFRTEQGKSHQISIRTSSISSKLLMETKDQLMWNTLYFWPNKCSEYMFYRKICLFWCVQSFLWVGPHINRTPSIYVMYLCYIYFIFVFISLIYWIFKNFRFESICICRSFSLQFSVILKNLTRQLPRIDLINYVQWNSEAHSPEYIRNGPFPVEQALER